MLQNYPITTEVILIAIAILCGIAANRIDRYLSNPPYKRKLRKTFLGNSQNCTIYYPLKDTHGAILPRTSTEDFLGVSNILELAEKFGLNEPPLIRGAENINSSERENNLFIICSPKANKLAKEAQDAMLRSPNYSGFLRFGTDSDGNWKIYDADGEYTSKTYEQIESLKIRKISEFNFWKHQFDDYAVVNKFKNPWNDQAKIVLVAGLRGIGTWGAARYLNKEWKEILGDKSLRENDFSLLIRVKYENFNIKATELSRKFLS